MKKLLALILGTLMLFSIVACDIIPSGANNNDNSTQENEKNDNSSENSNSTTNAETNDSSENNTTNKLNGTIIAASEFSEGIAFVKIQENNKTYGIDTNFNIVFTLDTYVNIFSSKFINGLARISDTAFCDRNGKITTADDIGVTAFPLYLTLKSYNKELSESYDAWREDGYIIAEITEASYSSSIQKLGVLNSKFEWIVDPSEKVYNLLKSDDIRTMDYIKGGYFFVRSIDENLDWHESYINIKTLEVTSKLPFKLPSENWISHTHKDKNGTYFTDYEGNIMVELTFANISSVSPYKNGTCVVEYYNQQAKKKYFNLVNEQGEFLFDPIEIGVRDWACHSYRSSNIILVEHEYKIYSSYDTKGNRLGQLDFAIYSDDNLGYSISSVNNDIIVIRGMIVTMHGAKIKLRIYDVYFNEIN